MLGPESQPQDQSYGTVEVEAGNASFFKLMLFPENESVIKRLSPHRATMLTQTVLVL
jgi:hypothetical protein